jgi:hypothetical protein
MTTQLTLFDGLEHFDDIRPNGHCQGVQPENVPGHEERVLRDDSTANAERAIRAKKAIEAYNDQYDLAGNIVDLLADLQHYCRIACTYDKGHRRFGLLLEMATGHFNAEIDGEDVP